MLYINVPYSEKDEAKALGAKWDSTNKTWYVERSADYRKFAKWIVGSREDSLSIVCDYFYVVETHRICYKCGKITRVIGFALEKWWDITPVNHNYNNSKFLFNKEFSPMQPYLNFLLSEFYGYLARNYNYKKGYSKATNLSYFANHCDHCGSIQGGFHLFAEPDSPFFIDSIEKARQLTFYKYKLSRDRIVYDSLEFSTSDYSEMLKTCSNFVNIINYEV